MPTSAHDSFEAARAQAADYLGFVASERITAPSGEVFEIPNPSLLDDEQQARVDALDLETESWDHHDILNEDGSVKIADGGPLKLPNRKNGELVENYNTQLAKALFADRFDAFKNAGGRSSDVGLIWGKMRRTLADRAEADSKSGSGSGDVAPVSEADKS